MGGSAQGLSRCRLAIQPKPHYPPKPHQHFQQHFQQRRRTFPRRVRRRVPLRRQTAADGPLCRQKRRWNQLEHQFRAHPLPMRRFRTVPVGIRLRPPRLLDRRPLLCDLVQRISRPDHRHRLDQRLQNLPPIRKRLFALQPQRRPVPTKDQWEFHDAQPPQRSRPYALRRDVPQPKPRPYLLGQAPFRDGAQAALGIHQDRRTAPSPSKPAKAGCCSITAC